MNTERSKEEIKKHRHGLLPDAERYRVVRCRLDSDFTAGTSLLVLTVSHMDTGAVRKLRFYNVVLDEPMLVALKDANGLYLLDTKHLGWAESQRIEVGDWDGGPPLFWAEGVEQTQEE